MLPLMEIAFHVTRQHGTVTDEEDQTFVHRCRGFLLPALTQAYSTQMAGEGADRRGKQAPNRMHTVCSCHKVGIGTTCTKNLEFKSRLSYVGFIVFPRFIQHDSKTCADAVPEALALGIHTVVLQREEYETLVHMSRQYESLKQNLIQGGVSYEAIVLLSNSLPSVPPADTPTTTPETQYVEGYHEERTVSSESSDESGFRGLYRGSEHNVWENADTLSENEDFLPDVPSWSQDRQVKEKSSPEDTPEHPDRVAQRTLQLSNLAEGTRHADITAAVRGGKLVDVFVWQRDRRATVSFCHGSDAADFYRFVCKNDLYIKQKRVEVSWNPRQYHLSGMVAWRVRNGGTRNLVIRGYRHEKSEKAIRDDLDHIHNLVVIKVEFNNGDCYINTNSVSAASFAKTCMMSRLKYKGSHIDFAPDECAQPLERITPSPCSIPPRPDGGKDFANGNRFALLDVAGH